MNEFDIMGDMIPLLKSPSYNPLIFKKILKNKSGCLYNILSAIAGLATSLCNGNSPWREIFFSNNFLIPAVRPFFSIASRVGSITESLNSTSSMHFGESK